MSQEPTPRLLRARPGLPVEPDAAYLLPQDGSLSVRDGVFVANDLDRVRALEAEVEAQRRTIADLRRATSRIASIGTLAGGIAHEINNPLNAILLTSQYALRHSGPLDLEVAMGTIVKEARHAARIVKDVIRLAREERLPMEPGDVNEVVTAAVAASRRDLAARRARVTTDLAPSLPPVRMSASDLQNVLLQLLRNAVEAVEDEIDVTIRTASDAHEVRIEVRDAGPGIHPDILPRIFDPFFTTRKHRGATGLGLSIAQGIAIEHGGMIDAESERNDGSLFILRLPIHAPEGE